MPKLYAVHQDSLGFSATMIVTDSCMAVEGNEDGAVDGEEDGAVEGDKDGELVGGGVKGGDFEIELTDQEKKRTEELVKAADAMFLAVEKGADPEDAGVEFDGEDCI